MSEQWAVLEGTEVNRYIVVETELHDLYTAWVVLWTEQNRQGIRRVMGRVENAELLCQWDKYGIDRKPEYAS